MKTVNLTKYGFIRREDIDFNDDGNRFKGYEYHGIVVTYIRYQDHAYINFRYDYDPIYEGYSRLDDAQKQAVRAVFNELNGIAIDELTEHTIPAHAEKCFKMAIDYNLL